MNITTDTQQLSSNNQPITPTDSLQYRAIGRLWGRYVPDQELIYKGQLITVDGVILNATLKKRASKVVQAQLDLSQNYLWTVYPKTLLETSGIGLDVSLISVRKPSEDTESVQTEFQSLADNFSVQGLVVYQDFNSGIVEVKIQQEPRSINDTPKNFKLRLQGFLPPNSVKCFWNFQVRRVGTDLVIQSGECIKYMGARQSKTENLSTTPPSNTHEQAEVNPT
ncbi:hypothetical protein [Nostoc sp. FACHB-888]|uniref:hypothetical protein n=1 Tax=Nostoc sp. FACHB-888 TaxID=2692842 RepID=UPI0016899164|nr:hypothetical protein [Nostoc sp. FACHB-888]MBD2247345.1 hypothetical protein [Nostoc sp. FACHB-888]